MESNCDKDGGRTMSTLEPTPPQQQDEPESNNATHMGFQQTVMYGEYSKALGELAKKEARKIRKESERIRKKVSIEQKHELTGGKRRGAFYRRTTKFLGLVWSKSLGKVEDWIFLGVLGIIMSFVSYGMDYVIDSLNHSRFHLYQELGDKIILSYLAWSTLPTMLVCFSAGLIALVAPTAAGSGLPELKTIFRGVVLKDFLSGKTLVAKAIGLMCVLGAGMPLGKEGPFVHIASIVATGLSNLITYANESKSSEMLAAACAVGVACCFGSPMGGVLFSIEVTAVFFAVRNYWRGFFSSVIGSIFFRLISVWLGEIDTLIAVFPTGFSVTFPFDVLEIYMFIFVGVVCGFGGAFYVYSHRRYVLWLRGNQRIQSILKKNRFIYPFTVVWLISTLSFPPWFGQFYAADIGTHDQIHVLFSNYTWTRDPEEMTVDEWDHVKHFVTPYTGIFVNLFIYMVMTYTMSIIASTLPVPTGALIPAFKIGAGLGRICGEAMHVWFGSKIIPGGYATVGAAAFTGAVTHTLSISVIVFEMTGQITHCLPMLISVLFANFIAGYYQPSIYDSGIIIKKLPYLPDNLGPNAYDVVCKDFMLSDVKYIFRGMTYRDLRAMLKEYTGFKGLPLVDSPDRRILLGSVKRAELISAIEAVISKERRLAVVAERKRQEDKRRLERQQRELTDKLKKLEDRKKPSRFEVSHVSPEEADLPDTIIEENSSDEDEVNVEDEEEKKAKKGSTTATAARKNFMHQSVSEAPSSRSRNFSGGTVSPSPYNTVTGLERLQSIFKRQRSRSGTSPSRTSLGSAGSPGSPASGKRVDFALGGQHGPDMPLYEQMRWEEEQMESAVDFDCVQVDPAPFQLVENTNMMKVHMFFSMMNMGRAYVTATGRLIGVVGLKELRDSITNADAIMEAKRQKKLDLEKEQQDLENGDQDQEKGDVEVDRNDKKSEQG